MTAREMKDYYLSMENDLARLLVRTLVKKPQTFVARRITVDMMKNGRLPQILAPAAVKNVVNPIQKARNPMTRLATMSMLTLYFIAMRGSAGVTIGPRDVVTPELKARRIIIHSFLLGDQLSGSFGLLEGCGCRIMSPSRLSSLESILESRVGPDSLIVDVPGGAAMWRSSRMPKPILVTI
jgi:hypothetical protein